METKNAVQTCSGCPLCKFTRNSRKVSFFYNLARKVQNACPGCRKANEALNKDYQKSLYIS